MHTPNDTAATDTAVWNTPWKDWVLRDADDVLTRLGTTRHGLAAAEAARRRAIVGDNLLRRQSRLRWALVLLRQFTDALVWVLLGAAALAAAFQEWRDVKIILIIVGINALIGFIQEYKAERTIEKLAELVDNHAVVVRDGHRQETAIAGVVPGDILVVAAGDRIPADGVVIDATTFSVNGAVFTGESRAEQRVSASAAAGGATIADVATMVFAGETAVTGEALVAVTATGMATELGRIADVTQKVPEDLTPLQRKMLLLSKRITIAALTISAVVIGIGQFLGMSLYANFLFALALAVSVVPEGLPAAIAVTFSLGMKRLLKKNILVKKLNAVETLGSVSVICSDKTGTITRNELTVVAAITDGTTIAVTGTGYAPQGDFLHGDRPVAPQDAPTLQRLLQTGMLANAASLNRDGDTYTVVGDPTEGAILVAGRKYRDDDVWHVAGETKVYERPFTHERRRMSVVYRNAHTVSYVKGSPDVLLERATHIRRGEAIVAITDDDRAAARAAYDDLSRRSLRVLACAERTLDDIPQTAWDEESERDLTWLGMLAMSDPPREDVAPAIADCRRLGLRVMMITGDYGITAEAIARDIGLASDAHGYEVLTGALLDTLTDDEVYARFRAHDLVFARTAPEQKLRIATLLRTRGEVVAMTGDGVNDAPALKRADIGIAMGITGSDVAKEAADMILLDDRFASIVRGVREGRTIFRNLRKFVHYIFTSNASELTTVVIGTIFHIHAPMTAVQILATDLGTDIFPSFALEFEPDEPDGTARATRTSNARRNVLGFAEVRRILALGVLMGVFATAAYVWSLLRHGWHWGASLSGSDPLYIAATSATYGVIAMTQMANLLQSRSERFTPLQLGFWRNPHAIGALLISVCMLLVFLYVPPVAAALGLVPLEWQDWLVVIIATIAIYVWEDRRKMRAQ